MALTSVPLRRSLHPSSFELVGVALVTWLAIWIGAAAVRGGVDVVPPLGLVAVGVAAYATARFARRLGVWQVPTVVTVGALTIALTQREILFDHLEGPLGYGNATAAFFTLAALHAAIVAHLGPIRPVRIAAGLAAVWFATVPWLNGSRAAILVTLLVPVAVWAQDRRIFPRVLRAGTILVLVSVAATSVVGAVFREPENGSSAATILDATLSERRVELWQDAVRLAVDAPLFGVGLGGFRELSPSAIAHPDKAWAHQEYLQLASETGVPGMLLLVGLVLWGFARIGRAADDPAVTWVLLGWVGVTAHASFDYILHFPGVVGVAGLLLGTLELSGPLPVRGSEGRTTVDEELPDPATDARPLLVRLTGEIADGDVEPAFPRRRRVDGHVRVGVQEFALGDAHRVRGGAEHTRSVPEAGAPVPVNTSDAGRPSARWDLEG